MLFLIVASVHRRRAWYPVFTGVPVSESAVVAINSERINEWSFDPSIADETPVTFGVAPRGFHAHKTETLEVVRARDWATSRRVSSSVIFSRDEDYLRRQQS